MFYRLPETKVFRDPIHGYIHVDLEVIWELIDTFAFQRLRRIHQLGGTHMVYHTAEHSRFSHSLGVYEIVRRMVTDVTSIASQISEYDKVTVMIAAMLHDVGHGPFSHAFEAITKVDHEAMTIRIIMEDQEIHGILRDAHVGLPEAVSNVICHRHENPLLSQLVSGQLDADRMDYLLRDSYITGTTYGNFDLERVLRTLRVHNKQLVVKESGIHTIEDYIMSRYHMYWQVYFHPLGRSYESMWLKLFQRMRYLFDQGFEEIHKYEMYLPFLRHDYMTVEEYQFLDEPAAMYGVQLMTKSVDPVLSDLSKRILKRDLFVDILIESEEQVEMYRNKVIDAGFDPLYYFHQDESVNVPYYPYVTQDRDIIGVLRDNNEVAELSQVSLIVSSIIQGKAKQDRRIFLPRTCL